jgi:hypothetical protein
MLWYSGFLPYHEEMVDINDNIHFKEVWDEKLKKKIFEEFL